MSIRTTLAATALLAVACTGGEPAETDPRINSLTLGIRRDSVLRILGSGTTGDSLANVYRREMYLLNGSMTEILFYSAAGLKEGQGEAAAESTLRPVILTDGVVTGWGWATFDSLARLNDIRARVR
jgi:hypothetical protein